MLYITPTDFSDRTEDRELCVDIIEIDKRNRFTYCIRKWVD